MLFHVKPTMTYFTGNYSYKRSLGEEQDSPTLVTTCCEKNFCGTVKTLQNEIRRISFRSSFCLMKPTHLILQIKIPSLLGSPMHGLPVSMAPFFNPYMIPVTLGARMPVPLPHDPVSDNSDSDVGEVSSASEESDLEEGEVRRPKPRLGKTTPNGGALIEIPECSAIDYSMKRPNREKDVSLAKKKRDDGVGKESKLMPVIAKTDSEDISLLKVN